MQPLKKSNVMLTAKECRCYRIAQGYRRQFLLHGVLSVYRIVWPRLLSRVSWSRDWSRRVAQIILLLLLLLWPVIVLWGLLEYVILLVRFPAELIGTYRVPKTVRSPGEKTLAGIHNAFQQVLELPDGMYIRCIDDWLPILFGERGEGQLMVEFVERERQRQRAVEVSEFQLAAQMRSELAVAREKLSKRLGHYLSDQNAEA